jgi:hypothetical protein
MHAQMLSGVEGCRLICRLEGFIRGEPDGGKGEVVSPNPSYLRVYQQRKVRRSPKPRQSPHFPGKSGVALRHSGFGAIPKMDETGDRTSPNPSYLRLSPGQP